jgi:hypothetical protein
MPQEWHNANPRISPDCTYIPVGKFVLNYARSSGTHPVIQYDRAALHLVEVEVTLRPMVSRPVQLGVGLLSGAHDQIFVFCLKIAGFLMLGDLSDERMGMQFTLTIASGPCQSSHSGVQVPQNSWPYFTASYETTPIWRARSLCLYPPGTGWPGYTPRHWVPFPSPLTNSQGYGGSILTRLHTGLRPIACQSQSQSYFATDGQSVSSSWCRAQSGTFDQRYYFFLITVLS